MHIVTTTSVFPAGFDAFKVSDRLYALGYRDLDMAFDYCELGAPDFLSPDYKAWAQRLRERADRLGMRFTHSHGSFDASSRGDLVTRNFECAKILGIRSMVIHPVFRGPDGAVYTDNEEFLEANVNAYTPLLALAEEYGVKILSENLLWGASIPPSVQSELVSRMDSPWFGWCYDVGHAHRCGLPQTELLGRKNPPSSLHIHDNHADHDEHLLPGDGTVDWKVFLDSLHACGYSGDLVLEAHHQSMDAPDEDRDSILADLLSRAQKMLDYYTHL